MRTTIRLGGVGLTMAGVLGWLALGSAPVQTQDRGTSVVVQNTPPQNTPAQAVPRCPTSCGAFEVSGQAFGSFSANLELPVPAATRMTIRHLSVVLEGGQPNTRAEVQVFVRFQGHSILAAHVPLQTYSFGLNKRFIASIPVHIFHDSEGLGVPITVHANKTSGSSMSLRAFVSGNLEPL